MKRITVPGSTANLGPGFDVFGLALNSVASGTQKFSISLELQIEELSGQLSCEIQCEGEGAESLSRLPEENLVTKVALYVLHCHGMGATELFGYRIRIISGIPLSRGLGSSAAAVVAGVMLGNELGKLNLSKKRMFDFCLMIERHPDNVGAALFGGYIGTFMRSLSPEDKLIIETSPSEPSEVLPGLSKAWEQPPLNIGSHHTFPINAVIMAVVIIPDTHLNTAEARERLPKHYTREDAVFNAQRCALLPQLLRENPLDAEAISEAMQDKFHQPYRAALIPGFNEVLQELTPKNYTGLLGVSLSGAGPSILALATTNFAKIAEAMITILSKARSIPYDWQLLEINTKGATCSDS